MANETYIALLYSIGIAGGKRLIMAQWRALMADIGLQNPRTVIATGNALFETANTDPRDLEARLEHAFARRFGRQVDTIVLSASSFRRFIRANPFPKESRRDRTRVLARIMREPLANDSAVALSPYLTHGERVKVVHGHLWMHFPQEPVRSRLIRVLTSERLDIGTVRNWNTLSRLNELLSDVDSV